jgi:methylthioribose-1-phosphate isomerase
MTPAGVGIENPAFDVTPAKYVAAIITERGVLRAPYATSIRAMANGTPRQRAQLRDVHHGQRHPAPR